jgi:hypothetical protein
MRAGTQSPLDREVGPYQNLLDDGTVLAAHAHKKTGQLRQETLPGANSNSVGLPSAPTANSTRASAASPSAASTVSGTIGLGPGLVYRNLTAGDFRGVEFGDGLLGFLIVRHFHKGEAARTSRFPVHNDIDRLNSSKPRKRGAEFLFRCAERQISHVDVYHFLLPFSKTTDLLVHA